MGYKIPISKHNRMPTKGLEKLQVLWKNKKVTTINIYNKTIEKIRIPPTSECFFSTLLNIPCDTLQEYYGIPFKATIYTKLRSFQLKIIHNIL